MPVISGEWGGLPLSSSSVESFHSICFLFKYLCSDLTLLLHVRYYLSSLILCQGSVYFSQHDKRDQHLSLLKLKRSSVVCLIRTETFFGPQFRRGGVDFRGLTRSSNLFTTLFFLFLQWLVFITALALLVCPFFYYIGDQSISPNTTKEINISPF